MTKKMPKKKIAKIAALFVLAGLSFLLLRSASLQDIRTMIEGFGIYAPLAYIAAFSVLPIFLFPVPPLALVSGILFGVLYGTVYTLIGAFINATLMFFLSRSLLREFVEQLIRTKIRGTLQKKLLAEQQRPLTYIFFILRLVPLVSYNLINYAAGITHIRYGNYMLSTIAGIIPGTVVFLNMGDKLLNVKSAAFLISVVLLLALSALSVIILKLYFKKTDTTVENDGNDHHSGL